MNAPENSDILASVVARLERVKGPDRNGWYSALCPLRPERHASFGFTATGFKCHGCNEQGSLRELAERLGIARPRGSDSGGAFVATYDYVDESGAPLFQAVRKRPKGFFQRRPDGHGGWINNLTGVRLVPYRLPHVLAADASAALFVVEGEKDADRLWAEGVPATTNPMGAGKWRDEYSEHLRDRRIVIVPDNDDAGRRHAADVARSVNGVAFDVRILELPDLPEKGDVSDWFDAGGSVDDLLDLAANAATGEPVDHEGVLAPPEIMVTNRHLHDLAQAGWAALATANNPPRFFLHGLDVAEVARDSAGRSSIQHLTIPGLRAVSMFASDGTLDCTPGYQRATRLYYEPTGETIPPVSVDPDATDLKRAKAYLHQEWLADFPFLDDASLAHAIAIPLTVIAREMIDGPTPLFAIDAPAPGSGKGLLASGIGIIVSGREAAVMTETRGEEERKRITALVRAGHPLLLLDNVKRKLESGTFAAMLTAPYWSDRILGATQDVELPVRGVWMATGNNLQFDNDISRRTVWIRIDARVDRPWERSNFQKENLSFGCVGIGTNSCGRAWSLCGTGSPPDATNGEESLSDRLSRGAAS